jgi:stage II sporulation protein D
VLSTDSGFAVINTLPIEDYLKGVVPHEIGALKEDAFEALKAQAVAARTYAYAHLGSRKSQGFDVFADTRDQVYNGSKEENSLVNKAIESTSGIVIKYNENLIEAFYHSTCGGKTEGTEVWGQVSRPYLLSVSDSANGKAYCEASKYMSWSETFTKAELKAENILIIEKFPSSRVKNLVVFAKDSSYEIVGDKTRWFFTKNGKILPSSLFTIKNNGDSFTVEGSGFGHGIGMCQFGVIARARAGQKFDEILKAYYSGVSVDSF